MIRLLLDQGLPRSAIEILGGAGYDVEHVGPLGMSAAADEEILEYAVHSGRVVCTLDADFHTLLAMSGATGPSVIRIRRQGMNGALLAGLMLTVLPRIEAALNSGAVVSITEQAIRFRFLPLRGIQE